MGGVVSMPPGRFMDAHHADQTRMLELAEDCDADVVHSHSLRQHHPVSSPPLPTRRHRPQRPALPHQVGLWPMEAWLRAFAAEGLVYWSGDAWRRIDHI